MTITLSDRELRTLRAALRCWQNELDFHSLESLRQHYPDLGRDPLTVEELDALLRRIGGAR